MRIHFIAIGGSIMHSLAIALKQLGHVVSGSDDQIYGVSEERLRNHALLPEKPGFFKYRITPDIDTIILGMHAAVDNPELEQAKELGIRILSFPEYVYEHGKDKKRVVIAGSHGKTTITSMVMHVLKYWEADFDYLVGAQLEGFESNVRLTEDAPVIILEGDEYLASRIHPISKFLYYKPHVALISGIAWDHYNVFPDYKGYVGQFKGFIESIEKNGTLIYNTEDTEVRRLATKTYPTINKLPYHTPGYVIENHKTFINKDQKRFPVKVFGAHNLQNLQGARIICNELGISDEDFYRAIRDFSGANRRLELIKESSVTTVFNDFAHAPSKVKATVEALKEQYPERKLVACLELHTYSSLNKEFIDEYKGCMDDADIAMVYYNPETLTRKGLPKLAKARVKQAFNNPKVEVFQDSKEIQEALLEMEWRDANLLLMTSGNFDGIQFRELADKVIYRTLDQ